MAKSPAIAKAKHATNLLDGNPIFFCLTSIFWMLKRGGILEVSGFNQDPHPDSRPNDYPSYAGKTAVQKAELLKTSISSVIEALELDPFMVGQTKAIYELMLEAIAQHEIHLEWLPTAGDNGMTLHMRLLQSSAGDVMVEFADHKYPTVEEVHKVRTAFSNILYMVSEDNAWQFDADWKKALEGQKKITAKPSKAQPEKFERKAAKPTTPRLRSRTVHPGIDKIDGKCPLSSQQVAQFDKTLEKYERTDLAILRGTLVTLHSMRDNFKDVYNFLRANAFVRILPTTRGRVSEAIKRYDLDFVLKVLRTDEDEASDMVQYMEKIRQSVDKPRAAWGLQDWVEKCLTEITAESNDMAVVIQRTADSLDEYYFQ